MRVITSWVLGAALAAGTVACTAPAEEFHLVIENHRFEPAEIAVPAGKRVKLVIENRDDTPEEFESHSMKSEKIVAANATISVLVGPLEAGSYEFFGEFNPETATGTLIAQ